MWSYFLTVNGSLTVHEKIKLSGYLLVRTNSSFCNRFPGSRDVLWHSSPDSDYHKDVRLASLMSKASGVSLSLPTFCSLSCCIFLSLSLPLAIFLGLFLFFFVPLSHAPDDAGWITLPHNSVEWSVLFFLHKYTFTVYYVPFFLFRSVKSLYECNISSKVKIKCNYIGFLTCSYNVSMFDLANHGKKLCLVVKIKN